MLGKQRAGPTGTARVRFFNEYTRVDNLAEGDYYGGAPEEDYGGGGGGGGGSNEFLDE